MCLYIYVYMNIYVYIYMKNYNMICDSAMIWIKKCLRQTVRGIKGQEEGRQSGKHARKHTHTHTHTHIHTVTHWRRKVWVCVSVWCLCVEEKEFKSVCAQHREEREREEE